VTSFYVRFLVLTTH